MQAAGYAGAHVLQNEKVEKRDSRAGRHAVPRVWRTVQEVRSMLGKRYFRGAYCMPYKSFLEVAFNLGTEDNCRSSEGATIFAEGWADWVEGWEV